MGASIPPDPVASYLAKYGQKTAPPETTAAPDPVAHYLAKYTPAGPSSDSAPVAPRSTLYNAIGTVDNALTMGLGQKFNAAVDALGDVIHGRDSFGHSYTKNLDADQAGLAKFRQDNPYIAATLGAVGGAGNVMAAAPLIAAGETANGLSLAQRTAAAARTGGALGAVGALGNAPNRGNAADQVITALKGGALGAGVGAAAVPLSQGAAAVIRRAPAVIQSATQRLAATNNISAPLMSPVASDAGAIAGNAPEQPQQIDRATMLLLNRLKRTGLTPQDAMDRLAQIPADKPVAITEIAGDQGHPLRQLAKWVARTPSTGAGQLRAAIAERMTPLANAQRVLGDVSEAFGQPRVNLLDNAEQLKQQQIANAQPFYERAFSDATPPVPLTAQASDEGPTLGDLLKRPSLQNAVKFHNEVALEKGEEPIQLPSGNAAPPSTGMPPFNPAFARDQDQWEQIVKLARSNGVQLPGDDGGAQAPGMGLKDLQRLKFKLDDMLGFAKRNGQLPDGTPATNAKLGAINDTRKALLDIMTNHSSDYAQGNAIWAGDAAMQDAGAEGQQFLSRPVDELRSLPTMTPGQKAQHNINAVSGPLRDRIFNTSAVDRAKMFQGPDMRERLEAVVPQDRLATLDKKLGYEHQIALTNQAVTGGSDTAENLANDADVSGKNIKSALSGIAMGRPRRVLTSAVRGVVTPAVDAWIRGINEQTANALAPKLTAGMQSRTAAENFLDDLATAYDRLQRTRGSVPYAGAAAGSATAALVSRQR